MPARVLIACVTLCFGVPAATLAEEESIPSSSRIQLICDDDQGQLHVVVDGNEAIVYRFGDDLDLVHYYPVRSPSGKSMTVQQTEPYPHHRSFWFGDKVQLPGQRAVSFYSALYSRKDGNDPKSPFNDRVRHVAFTPAELPENASIVRSSIVWEMDCKTAVIHESREMRIVPLTAAQYFLDLTFTLTAPTDDVTFLSDWVHYAWPFVRMAPVFSGEQGGTITNSEGAVTQAKTNGQVADGKAAKWMDYTNTVEGETEGLAIFSHPENEHPHGWLTREYGCFGPRRPDRKSGKRFTLKQGDTLRQRVGILVHRGNVTTGKVAEHYARYAAGDL
ncbi:MAG: DUF6807 family protein [Pirellulaceae bacterium]